MLLPLKRNELTRENMGGNQCRNVHAKSACS